MSRLIVKSLAASLLTLSTVWGAAAGGDLPAGAHPSADVLSCDIRVVRQGASVVLEGLVFAPAPVSGFYELQISQGGYAGGSNIRQSGVFDAAPGSGNSLGIVSLSSGGAYTATLTVHWDDGAPSCTRQVGTGRHL